MTEDTQEAQPASPPSGDDGEKKGRTRRSKEQIQADARAAALESLKDLPPFDPIVLLGARADGENPLGHVSATVKRVVRTGQYESFELMLHAELPRDPRFSVGDNLNMVGQLATMRCNALADWVQGQTQVEK